MENTIVKYVACLTFLFTCFIVNAEVPVEVLDEVNQSIKVEQIDMDPGQLRRLKLRQQESIESHIKATKPSSKGGGTTTISGTVLKSGIPPDPVDGHSVELRKYYPEYGRFFSENSTLTDVSGNYSFTVDVGSTYQIQVGNHGDDYLDYTWNVTSGSQQLCSNCEVTLADNGIVVPDPTAIANIDFSIAAGGVIEGQVYDGTSQSAVETLSFSLVNTDESVPNYQVIGTFSSGGLYSIKGIPDGVYRLYLHPLENNMHVPEIYGGPQCNLCWPLVQDGIGSTLTIASANTISNVDFSVELGASISGFLVDQTDLQAHYDYGLIMIFNELNYNLAAFYVEGDLVDPLNDGSYTIGGLLAGSYYVQGGDLGRQYYQRELFESIPCPYSGCNRGDGDPVVLAHQQNLAGINIQLNLGGKISGFLKDDLGAPLTTTNPGANQWFQIFDADGNVAGGGYVSDILTGEFELARSVAPGNYTLRTGTMFSGEFNIPYIDELYDNIQCPGESCDLTSAGSGTPIAVAESMTTSGIIIELSTGNSFTGLITELGGAAPIPDVHVLAYTATNPPKFATWATTDAGGNFTIEGLPDGDYYLLTNNGSNLPFMGIRPTDSAGWIDILYNGIACPGGSCDFSTGDVVTLPISSTRNSEKGAAPDIEFSLTQGATISGKITDYNLSTPISDVMVNVYDSSGTFISSSATNSLGEYRTSGLPAGTYYLTTSSFDVLVDVIYGGGYCFESSCNPLNGTPVVLTEQQVATGYNMVLRPDFVFANDME